MSFYKQAACKTATKEKIGAKGLFSNVGLAIWTTTPWTIPGNAAAAVNEQLLYAVVEIRPYIHKAEEIISMTGRDQNILFLP